MFKESINRIKKMNHRKRLDLEKAEELEIKMPTSTG